jgi:16S rRNA (cytidine1402-2'-O)-methyltransferase
MKGTLYIVSTPIGNYDDITLRGIKILQKVSFVICEEFKDARRLLSNYQIQKELISLNEHNENDFVNDILLRILNGEDAALISDCGTPLFSDPGHLLVDVLISQKIKIVPVPGANSLLPALVGSGLSFEKFYYYGWLSPKKDIRRKQLLDLRKRRETIVLLDTPYRLKTLMEDIVKILGPNIPCVLAFELTKEEEKFYRGNAQNILTAVERENLKGEFVLILKNQ